MLSRKRDPFYQAFALCFIIAPPFCLQDELDQWAVASKQKEDDNAVLAKYAKQDNAKIRDLSLKAEKRAKEVHAK